MNGTPVNLVRGITPKFTIKDSRGDTYLIKLDPARFPELPSSVEVISTKIFHAIGYWVPEDTIVHFPISQLQVAPGAQSRIASGDKRPIEMADVEKWLTDQPRAADGTIRALASRFVPGKVVGSSASQARAPTIRTTSSRTSVAASCAACASSPPG